MPKFKNPIPIDPDNLDLECWDHSNHVLSFTEQEADARHAHAQAKAAFELAEAKLLLVIRRNTSKYDLPDKPALDLVKAAVITSQKYQDAQAEMFEAKRLMDRLAGMVSALDHRRSMLTRGIELHMSNYRGEPRPKSREARDAVEESAQRHARRGMKSRNR